MTDSIDSSADVIDVRDIIERIEHLEQLEQPGPVDLGDDNDADQDALFAELALLREFMDDMKGYSGNVGWRGDWYPSMLIRDSYFEEYARELAEDIGAIDRDASWPLYYIDWERAARDLQQDYTSVEFEGVTYWYR